MHAIDVNDFAVVSAILHRDPELATIPFVDPLDRGTFISPIHFASQIAARRDVIEAVDIIKLLVEDFGAKVTGNDSRDSKGRTPLHFAVTGHFDRVTQWLLAHGASANAEDLTGRSALHFCASVANLEALLKAGADIDHVDKSGYSSIHAAALAGSEDLVKALIARNATLGFKNNQCGSPLHCAISKGFRSIATALLEAKVDVNEAGPNGDTPLHLVAKQHRSDLLQLLITSGADPSITNNDGRTPFHIATISGNVVFLGKFISRKGSPVLGSIPAHSPLIYKVEDRVQMLRRNRYIASRDASI
jgi:ankyrin repeat protein